MSGGRLFGLSKRCYVFLKYFETQKSCTWIGNIDDSVKVEDDATEDMTELLTALEYHLGEINAPVLLQESYDVSDHIVGHNAYI